MRVWIILWNMNISAYYMCFNFFLSKLLLCLSFIWDSKQGIKRNELVSLELELFLRMLWLQRWKWDFKYLHCNCLQLVFDQKNEGKKKKVWFGWMLLCTLSKGKFSMAKEMVSQRIKRNGWTHRTNTCKRYFKKDQVLKAQAEEVESCDSWLPG